MTAWVRVAARVGDTEAEGPGRRWALWVQGCPLRCAGCCNPEMLPERSRDGRDELISVEDLAREALSVPGIEGVTFLGGEPFAQPEALGDLAERVKAGGLHVMVFSGFTLAELQAREDHGARRLLAATDLLVDGRYDATQPDTARRWVGSRNQVMHELGALSRSSVAASGNTVELRFSRGALTVNGWPAAAAGVVRGRS